MFAYCPCRALVLFLVLSCGAADVCSSLGCTAAERDMLLADDVPDGLHLLQAHKTMHKKVGKNARVSSKSVSSSKSSSSSTNRFARYESLREQANNARSEEYRPSMAEWVTTRGELLELRGMAKNATGSKNAKNVTMLEPMLVLLKGLYNDSKHSIGRSNEHEKVSKTRFASQEAKHESRIAAIDERSKNHKVSLEFATNETSSENRMFEYWTKVRNNEHKQFVSFLSIKHGMMSKMKTMIDVYEQVIAGSADSDAVDAAMSSVGTGLPVALLQYEAKLHLGVLDFCQDALDRIDAELLLRWPAPAEPMAV